MSNTLDSIEMTLIEMSKEMEKVKNTDDLVLFAMSESILLPLRFMTHELKRIQDEQKKQIAENKKLVCSQKNTDIIEYILYNQKIRQNVA